MGALALIRLLGACPGPGPGPGTARAWAAAGSSGQGVSPASTMLLACWPRDMLRGAFLLTRLSHACMHRKLFSLGTRSCKACLSDLAAKLVASTDQPSQLHTEIKLTPDDSSYWTRLECATGLGTGQACEQPYLGGWFNKVASCTVDFQALELRHKTLRWR